MTFIHEEDSLSLINDKLPLALLLEMRPCDKFPIRFGMSTVAIV